MVNLTNYPYLEYEPSKIAAGIIAFVIGLSLIIWIVQSIQSHFQPRRISVLILMSHVAMFLQFILRAVLSSSTLNSILIYTIMAGFLAAGQRVIIICNYDFLIQVRCNLTGGP
ncbi:unnamed protein product [Rotaria socialis]|uniref:Uncharacterized protein n=1 Tax=Rotaria socialis TaxID=392032 RepID=A0A821AVU8_9BILA|nr:unnamed protein product [Rotaria socialis]CAF4581890.1 unnamed protein product [Rotaria socialis]